jgi:beta-galactosidase
MASDRLFVSQIKGGRLLGLSNGDNEDHENARNKNRKLFNGAMSAIFAVDEGVAELSYILEDPERGLKKEVKTAVVAAPSPLRVPLCDSILEIKGLREWPLTELKGALDKAYNFSDMNTSQPINIEEFTQPSRTGCSVITGRFVVPDFPSSLHLFVKFEHLSGCGTIKIFHETNCWPNPEPEEFLTLDIPFHQESGDLLIELKGFGCKELLNMVIAIDNTKPFTSGKIVYLFQ